MLQTWEKINWEASPLARYFHGPPPVGPGDNDSAFSSSMVLGPVGAPQTIWLGDPHSQGQEGAPGNLHFPSESQIPLLT